MLARPSVEELDALALGAQMVASWGDRDIARSARAAIDKITAVLPGELRAEITQTALYAPPSQARVPIRVATASGVLRVGSRKLLITARVST